jgi:hypothetical protein
MKRAFARTVADEIGDHELGVGVQRGPCPDIASASGSRLGGLHVALFGVAEAPDFIALHPLRFNAQDLFVMQGEAGFPSVIQELGHGIDAHAHDAGDRPHRRSLAEHVEDLGAGLGGQFVHARNI